MTTTATINFQFPRLFFKIHTSESFIVLFSSTKLARLFPLKEFKPSSDRQVIQYTQFQRQVPRESKTSWFPERPDIKVFCYISRLSLQQQQKNNRSVPKQST